MKATFLDLPERTAKPRQTGTTSLIDGGVPLEVFRSTLESHHPYIDFVKLGWGTSVVTHQLSEKLAVARALGIECFFGGTLFEKSVVQGRVREFRDFCHDAGLEYVEISNGTISMSNEEKATYIREFSGEFKVFSEVGFKDQERSINLHPAKWLEYIEEDLDAGAFQVITESRESGSSGVCRADGELRFGLIREILESSISADDLVFEAPRKAMQVFFIENVGANVNLGNIAFVDALAVETLRLGLRGDTLLWSEAKR